MGVSINKTRQMIALGHCPPPGFYVYDARTYLTALNAVEAGYDCRRFDCYVDALRHLDSSPDPGRLSIDSVTLVQEPHICGEVA